MGVKDEGMIHFWTRHPNAQWASDDKGYQFPEMRYEGITVQTTKHPDRTLEIQVSALGTNVAFRHPVPATKRGNLSIAVSWSRKDQSITLYLGGVTEKRTLPTS